MRKRRQGGRTEGSVSEQWQVNKFLWLCLLFVCLYLPIGRALGHMAVPLPTAFGILGLAGINAAARTYFGWKRGGSTGDIGWLFTICDVILISTGVRLTGGIQSELWPLYFVIMISEALYADLRQTTLIIGGVLVAYLLASWPEKISPDYAVSIVSRLFFLVIVGTFARRLSVFRQQRTIELMRLNEQVAASEERARIAREIHDSLGHALVASFLRLELCSRVMRQDPEEAEQILKSELPALRAAWSEGRNLAFHLRPWEPDEGGFAQGLRRHLGRFAERTGLAIDLNIEDEAWRASPDVEVTVTRVLQEALTNVARHAQASRAGITLRVQDGSVHGDIRDDGVGCDVDRMKGGFGLSAMNERIERLGGSLSISSKPGEGTSITFRLPVRQESGQAVTA